jgi:hypothetical protein
MASSDKSVEATFAPMGGAPRIKDNGHLCFFTPGDYDQG